MRSWLLTSISSLILFSTISYIGHFHNYWRKHSKAYERASVFIKTETCTNPRVRATLGDFNLCDESESILSREPFVSALYEVAEDLNICGHNRCTILYMDVTKNFYKWIIGIFILALVGVWVGVIDMKQMWDKKVMEHYSLPTKMD
jgi:hypothetical protein